MRSIVLGGVLAYLANLGEAKKKASDYEPDFTVFTDWLERSVKGDQYSMERHTVTTKDGYILNLMRIVPKQESL